MYVDKDLLYGLKGSLGCQKLYCDCIILKTFFIAYRNINQHFFNSPYNAILSTAGKL